MTAVDITTEPIRPVDTADRRPPRFESDVVFVSYRTALSTTEAAVLEERFQLRYSRRWVFRDTDNLREQWAAQLRRTLEEASVVVAVISEGWEEEFERRTAAHETDGPDHKLDWVRWELSRAHELDKPVIPVLIDRGRFAKDGIPEDLRFLSQNQAHAYRPDDNSTVRRASLRALAAEVDDHLPWQARRLHRITLAFLVLAVALAVAVPIRAWWQARQLPSNFSLEGDRVVLVAPPTAPAGVEQKLVDQAAVAITERLAAAGGNDVTVQRLTQQQWDGQGRSSPEVVVDKTRADLVFLPTFASEPGRLTMTAQLYFGTIVGGEPLAGELVAWLEAPVVQLGRTEAGSTWQALGEKGAEASVPVIDLLQGFEALDRVRQDLIVDRFTAALEGGTTGDARGTLSLLRGNALMVLGRFDEAIDDFEVTAQAEGQLGARGALGVASAVVAQHIRTGCQLSSGEALAESIVTFDRLASEGDAQVEVKALVNRARAEACIADAVGPSLPVDRRIVAHERTLATIDEATEVFARIQRASEETQETLAVGLAQAGDRWIRIAELEATDDRRRADLDSAIAVLDSALSQGFELRPSTQFDLRRLLCLAHERLGNTQRAAANRLEVDLLLDAFAEGQLIDQSIVLSTSTSLECGATV